MTKTRAAAAAESGSAPTLSIDLPNDVDLETLTNLLPGFNPASIAEDTVVALCRALIEQLSNAEEALQQSEVSRAEVERKDIELDQALQDKERGAREYESQIEEIQNELNHVKQERDALASSNADLQRQVSELSKASSSSSVQTEDLKLKLDDIEREKRDLVGVISRLEQDATVSQEETKSLRTNLKEARQEHHLLESQLRDLRSNETALKFKVDSLSQQLELAQTERDRLTTDLTTKSDEFAKYRREKQAELVSLQGQLDVTNQSLGSTQSTLKALQSSYASQKHEYTEALGKIQDLTGRLAEQEVSFTTEATTLRRLVTVLEDREKSTKEVVENIEKEWAVVGDRAEVRENELKAAIEEEKRGREEAEKRLAQLEVVMEKMNKGELPLPGRQSLGITGMSDEVMDGMYGLSPTVAIASKAQKSGRTFTEVYADYVRLQEDYAKKSAEYDHMDRTLAAVLAQIEERAPVLSQQRVEYERLQSEAAQLATQLAHAISERDNQAKVAMETSQKLTKTTQENDVLQTQLNDIGRQVQGLLRVVYRYEHPGTPADDELEDIAPAANVQEVITNGLVLYKSIEGVQEQNMKLLKIVREMGEQMEMEEKKYKEELQQEQVEAVKEAHLTIQELSAQLERQKKSHETIIQAYIKERETLKAMLARVEKGQPAIGDGSDGIGRELVLVGSGAVQSTSLSKELAEIQGQFEAYRKEMGIDAGRLREEVVEAQRESGQLSAALAKAQAKIEFLTERHRLAQEQYELQSQDFDNLNRRYQKMYDQWTRIDIEFAKTSDELATVNGRCEQLRTECANLKAEKKIWESAQSRLVEENRTLSVERSHLSDLMANVQKMHSDLERSGENDRRRLESQLQLLEGQTQDLKTQLSQERDTARHLALQRDIEIKDLQSRLDKTIQDSFKVRESLVGAEASKKHLEERVGDLLKQLRVAEEKLVVYERRPGATAGIPEPHASDASRNVQLEAEVAELRIAVKAAEVDLAAAKRHAQQFQDISQANEAALANVNATHEEYKSSTEAQIARLESELVALRENLETARRDLNLANSAHEQLRKTYDAERKAWLEDKRVLEGTLIDLTNQEKSSSSENSTREARLQQLEERANAAERKFSQEVLSHADSRKQIESLQEKLAAAQTAARESRTAAETASANLTTSQASWAQQKETLEKELTELGKRIRDLTTQNQLLHQHLDSVSSQAARIKNAADSSVPSEAGETGDDSDTRMGELRTLIAHLRQQREVTDLQLDLSKQETTRLKTQITHLEKTLEETRKALSEERDRAVQNAASAVQHAELMERINQVNILRESNATIRTDLENQSKRARELETKVRQLTAELDPAREEARVAKAELEARDAQIRHLEEESKRWQERNSQLLSKYDRIDPAEMQALRDEIEQLKQARSELEERVAAQAVVSATDAEKISSLEADVARRKEIQAENHNRAANLINKLKAQRQELQDAKDALQHKHDDLVASQAAQPTNVPNAEQSVEIIALTATIAEITAERNSVIQERDTLLAEKKSLEERIQAVAAATPAQADSPATEEERQKWAAEREKLLKEKTDLEEKFKNLRMHASKQINQEKQKNLELEKGKADAITAAIEEYKKSQPPVAAPLETAVDSVVAEKLREQEQKLIEKHKRELEEALAASRKETPDIAQALAKANAEFEERLAVERAAAMESGRMEVNSKVKLKDSQLVRAQAKLKKAEEEIAELKKASGLPVANPGETPTPKNATAGPSTPAISRPPATPSQTTAPLSPLTPLPATPLPTRPTAALGRGALRGAGRGGAAVRGAPAGRGRGIDPLAAVQAASASNTPLSGGVQIAGAAKRPREEGQTPSDESSLAKRLKAAEPGQPKPPVAIRRPPAPPTS